MNIWANPYWSFFPHDRPLFTISMSIGRVRKSNTPEERDRYLKVFQGEYDRHLSFINQCTELQRLINPNTISLLNQFKLLG